MNKKIILLVEDNPDDVDLTLRAFSKSRIANDVVVARDGAEALEYLTSTGKYAGKDVRELPQVVLLDLHLPKISGFEVLRAIRADPNTKLLPVVILTSSAEENDILESYGLGVNSYIRKPVDFHLFTETVRNLGMYWLLLNEPPPVK